MYGWKHGAGFISVGIKINQNRANVNIYTTFAFSTHFASKQCKVFPPQFLNFSLSFAVAGTAQRVPRTCCKADIGGLFYNKPRFSFKVYLNNNLATEWRVSDVVFRHKRNQSRAKVAVHYFSFFFHIWKLPGTGQPYFFVVFFRHAGCAVTLPVASFQIYNLHPFSFRLCFTYAAFKAFYLPIGC